MNSVSCAGRSNLNVLNVGKLSKSLVSPNLLTIVAYPVLYVTVLGAGRSLCRYILCRILKCRNGKVLVVGYDGACCIKVVYVAVSAVPVLKTTGVVTTCLNTLAVNSVSCAGSADSNRHLVCLNSAVSIKPSITAIRTVPVLNITKRSTCRSLSLYVYDGMSCIGIGLLEALHTYLITGIEVGMYVRSINGNSYCSALKGNGYGAAGGSNGVSLISGRICSTPIVVTSNLKLIRACRNVGVYLGVNTVSICHVVCSILGSPLSAHMCTGACNSKGRLLITSGAKVSRVVCMSKSAGNLLTTLCAKLSSCTCSRSTTFVGASGIHGSPCSATLIPGTIFNGEMVSTVSGNGKVSSLIPLIVPVVSRSIRIHSAENNLGIGLIGRNLNLINSKGAIIGHTNPCFAISEEIRSKTSIIYLPIRVGSKVKILGLACCTCKDCCHTHEHCEYKHKSNKNFACVFHFVFSLLSFFALNFFTRVLL